MKQRCFNPKTAQYKNYGQRGITVCQRWLDSFDNFLADMGIAPSGMSIDRVDVNGNYEPANCKWAANKEQQNNRRNNHRIEFNGKCLTLREWASYLGRHETTLQSRLKQGYPLEMVLSADRFSFGRNKAVEYMKRGEA